MQEEVTQKVIALSVKAAKLDAAALQKAIKLLLRQIEKQRGKPPRGKQTMRQLTRSGERIANIEITDSNIKAFEQTARKYGVDFSLKKDIAAQPPRYLVFFKGKDVDVLTAAFREFSARKLKQEKKPSIRKALSAAKEQAKQLNAGRETIKKMERGQSL